VSASVEDGNSCSQGDGRHPSSFQAVVPRGDVLRGPGNGHRKERRQSSVISRSNRKLQEPGFRAQPTKDPFTLVRSFGKEAEMVTSAHSAPTFLSIPSSRRLPGQALVRRKSLTGMVTVQLYVASVNGPPPHIVLYLAICRALWETGQPDFRRGAKALAADGVARVAMQNASRIHKSEE
jgi:hypothetical protein